MTQRSPVVLVTGASSGIGRAVAKAFAAKGFEVFGTTRNPRTAEPIPGVELVELDVTDAASVDAAVKSVIERTGRIDILVNNAGSGILGAAEESSVAQAQRLIDTNFLGLVRLTNAVLPYLRAQGCGRVINIGSVLGFLPQPYGALYAGSKHAVEGIPNRSTTRPANSESGSRSSNPHTLAPHSRPTWMMSILRSMPMRAAASTPAGGWPS